MGLTAGEINILIRARDQASRVMAGIGGNVKKLGESVKRFAKLAALAFAAVGAAVVVAGLKFANAASDQEEALNKALVTFGRASAVVEEFAEGSANAFGLSKAAALEYAATLGVILQASGLSEKASADMSVELVELAADLASFNNIPVDVALEKIRSGLVGEVEPLRTVGVLLSEATIKTAAYTQGIAESGAELTEAQKVQARFSVILDQTALAQGDFERTSDSLANSQRRLGAVIENVQAALGKGLAPILAQITGRLTNFLAKHEADIERFGQQIGESLGDGLERAEQAFRDFQPVLEDTVKAFRTFFQFIVTNKPIIVTALLAIGAAMIVAFPHVVLAAAIVAIVANIKLLSAELDDLGITALETRLFIEKLELSFVAGSNKLLDLIPSIRLVRDGYEALRGEGDLARQAEDALRDTVAATTKELVTQKIAIIAATSAASGMATVLTAELSAAVEGMITRFELGARSVLLMASALQALRDRGLTAEEIVARLAVLSNQFRVQLEGLQAIDLSGVLPSPEVAAAAGETMGDNIIDGIETAFLDRPAVGPEELLRILQFLEAADFTTIGDQLAFVQALANQTVESVDRLGDALATISQIAGVGVGALELRFGLRNELQELNAAVRIFADELGLTEAEVISMLRSTEGLTEAEEDLADSVANATENFENQLHTFDLVRQAIEEFRLDTDNLVGTVSRLFGVGRDEAEAFLRLFPEIANAMDAAFAQGQEDLRDMLEVWGLTQDEIQEIIEGVNEYADSVRDANDALSEQQGLWREVRRLINQGVLTDPAVIQEILQQGGIGSPPPPPPPTGLPIRDLVPQRPRLALGAGTPAPIIQQSITVVVEDRSPAAVARAVEQGGLELGEQLAAEVF